MRLGLSLAAAASLSGCGNGPQGSTVAVAESKARLVALNQGPTPASIQVTAVDRVTWAVAVDRTIDLQGGGVTVVDLTLPAATYTFAASLAGASGSTDLGSSAEASLGAGATTQIQLSAMPDAQGAGAVEVAVGAVPQIEGVDVQVDGSGPGAAVNVHVDASSPRGGALGFFWAGACLTGVVAGSSTLTLSSAGLADVATSATPVVHVVAQDAAGVATSADIVLTVAEGTAQGTIASLGGGAPSAECLGAQAQCAASCNAGLGAGVAGGTATASCLAGCGASLATCTAQ
jgi:hypothetical protein